MRGQQGGRAATEPDPEPLTIALACVTVYSAVISTLNIVLRHLEKVAQESIRPLAQSLLSIESAMERLQSQLRVLTNFLETQRVSPRSPLVPGMASIRLGPGEYETYKRLVHDTLEILRVVNDEGIFLATLLSQYQSERGLAQELRSAVAGFNEARYSRTYGEFFRALEKTRRPVKRTFRKIQRELWKHRRTGFKVGTSK